MAIDVEAPFTAGWWLNRCAQKLAKRQPELKLLTDYYEGKPPLPEPAPNARAAYETFVRKSRLNLAEFSTRAVMNRMQPLGFDMGEAADNAGNAKLAKVFTKNGLIVEANEVHRNMLVRRDGYAIVGLNNDTGVPIITAEDPRQLVTFHDPAQQRRVRAGAKFFHDPELEADFGMLYLPGRVMRAYRPARYGNNPPNVSFSPAGWEWDATYGGVEGIPLGAGLEDLVPIVRFRNEEGKADFEPHLDAIDRLNYMILQRLTIATFQAFKQRGIKVPDEDMPEKDEAGNVIDYNDVFAADPGALWKLPASAEMWESGAVDLGPILEACRADVRDYCMLTGTPLYYAFPDAAGGSAEGAQTMRETAVYKAEDRIRRAGAGWAQVEAIALRLMGDTKRADKDSLRMVWQPAERYSLAERADAASKAGEDLPWSMRMRKIWQLTPQEIEEARLERDAEKQDAPPEPTPPPNPDDLPVDPPVPPTE